MRDEADEQLKQALAIAIVRKRAQALKELQAWKRKAGVLEEEVRRLRQQLRGHEDSAHQAAALALASSQASAPRAPEVEGACLDVLAAEHERGAGEGRNNAARQLLAQVRCHQLASALLAAQCSSMGAAAAATARAAIGSSEPLQAVAAFVLGPLLRAQPGSLRAALGAQACAFVCREAELRGGRADTRAALTDLISGLINAILRGNGGAAPDQANTQAHSYAHLCPGSSAGEARFVHDTDTGGGDPGWAEAWSGQHVADSAAAGDERLADDLAADLLAALLQLPASGPLVLCAAASRLLSCKEDVLASGPRPEDASEASWADVEDRAEVLFALLEDCFALLPVWMRQQPAGAAAAEDVAQATRDILAAHKAWSAREGTARATPAIAGRMRAVAAALITGLERMRDCQCG